jgi:zinc protease
VKPTLPLALAALASLSAAAASCRTTVVHVGPGDGSGSAGSGSGSAGVIDDGVPWATAGVDWSRPPAPLAETAYVPPSAREWKLANGARVVLIENHRLPLVAMQVLIADAGAAHARSGLAALTADLMDESAGTLSADALAEALENAGAALSVGVDRDGAALTMSSLRAQLPAALDLASAVLLRPAFTAGDFKRVKADRIEDLRTRVDSPRAVAQLVFAQTMYAGHPYAEPVAGFEDTVTALSLADVRAFWKSAYTADRATIIIAGDVDAATAEAEVARAFAGWKPGVRKGKAQALVPPTRGVPRADGPRLVLVDRPDAAQSVVAIGAPGPTQRDDAYDAREIINTALGGTFASRLNALLREQLGYTYGVSSRFRRGDLMGDWTVGSALRSDVTVAGIKEILRVVEATRASALPAPEFAKAQQYLTRQFPQSFETNGALVGAFAELVQRGRPLDDHASFASRIAALTPAQAQASIAALWTGLSVVVVGDVRAWRAEADALGLPVTVVDATGVPVP